MNRFNVTDSLRNILVRIIDFLPNLIAALLILLIGYWIAKVVGRFVRKALHRLRFDRAMHTSAAGSAVSRVVESPAKLVGQIVFWLIYIGVISLAVAALNLPILNSLLASIYSYVPRVIAAILIFLVASAISAGTDKFVQRVMGRTATAKLIMAIVPAIVMSLAVFMILNQLNIARDIVNILFTAIVGAVALGLALAFGLGGRDVARELLEQTVNNARQNSGRVQEDLRTASINTKREAQRMKDM